MGRALCMAEENLMDYIYTHTYTVYIKEKTHTHKTSAVGNAILCPVCPSCSGLQGPVTVAMNRPQ